MPDEIKAGDLIPRIYGDGYLTTEMRVSAVDDKFIYCDAQNGIELPEGADPWKFDRTYGVETDEEQGWGVEFGLVLTRLDLPGVNMNLKVINHG